MAQVGRPYKERFGGIVWGAVGGGGEKGNERHGKRSN